MANTVIVAEAVKKSQTIDLGAFYKQKALSDVSLMRLFYRILPDKYCMKLLQNPLILNSIIRPFSN